jgi:type III restriction enzyme
MAETANLENPILNSPYGPPGRHFVIGLQGPTGEISVGRRPSESYIPVPVGKKGVQGGGAAAAAAEQEGLDFGATRERRVSASRWPPAAARPWSWRC